MIFTKLADSAFMLVPPKKKKRRQGRSKTMAVQLRHDENGEQTAKNVKPVMEEEPTNQENPWRYGRKVGFSLSDLLLTLRK